MKRWWVWMVMLAAVLGACGGSETSTGSGGGGDATSTATTGGGDSTSTATGEGGTGGAECTDPHDANCVNYEPDPAPEYTVDAPAPLTVEGLVTWGAKGGQCSPISPLANEDGSWTRIVMKTPPKEYTSFRWIAARGNGFAIPTSWRFGLANVAPSLDPMQAKCGPGASDIVPIEAAILEAEDEVGNPLEFVILEHSITGGQVADGSHWVVCLQNYVDADDETTGAQPSAVIACGMPDAGNVDRDQWQDPDSLGGAIHAMCDYGPNYCAGWMATLL